MIADMLSGRAGRGLLSKKLLRRAQGAFGQPIAGAAPNGEPQALGGAPVEGTEAGSAEEVLGDFGKRKRVGLIKGSLFNRLRLKLAGARNVEI